MPKRARVRESAPAPAPAASSSSSSSSSPAAAPSASPALPAAPLQLVSLAPPASAPVQLFARLERDELLLLAAPTAAGAGAALLRSAAALRACVPALERVVARGVLVAGPAGAAEGADAGVDAGAPPYALLRLAGGRAAALAVLARPLALPAADSTGRAVGLRAWLAAHNAAGAGSGDARAQQAEADAAMALFEAGETAAGRARAELAARMQADGFTLVTRRSRVDEGGGDDEALARGGGFATDHSGGGGGGGGGRESTNAKRKRRRGDIAARGFYAENAGERRGARLEALRAGFDEDRARIARTKAARSEFRG
jgi:hypothetical protein